MLHTYIGIKANLGSLGLHGPGSLYNLPAIAQTSRQRTAHDMKILCFLQGRLCHIGHHCLGCRSIIPMEQISSVALIVVGYKGTGCRTVRIYQNLRYVYAVLLQTVQHTLSETVLSHAGNNSAAVSHPRNRRNHNCGGSGRIGAGKQCCFIQRLVNLCSHNLN